MSRRRARPPKASEEPRPSREGPGSAVSGDPAGQSAAGWPLGRWLYWTLPLLLGGLQAFFTARSLGRVQYEELAESVRNVYWFDQHAVYDGISSNVGWYGLLWLAYSAAGFSIHLAKWVRLAVAFAGLLSTASLLERYLPRRQAAAWLLILGTSPTALSVATQQTAIGIDLALLPIAALLLVWASGRHGAARAGLLFAGGGLAMLAAMCFPTFLFCWLPLLLVAWGLPRPSSAVGCPCRRWPDLAALALGFAAPLAAALAWLDKPGLLLRDPANGAGLFRGGGGQLAWRGAQSLEALGRIARDLFVEGNSYYFRLPQAELSYLAPVVLAALFGYWRWGRGSAAARRLGWALLLLALSCLAAAALGDGPPGLRRATPLVAAFYLLAILCQRGMDDRAAPAPRRIAAWVGVALLLGHHLAVLPTNLRSLEQPLPGRRAAWFATKPTAQESLDDWVARVDRGEPLRCGAGQHCRFGEIFAALASVQRFNRHAPVEIRAVDPATGATLPLSLDLFQSYRLAH